MKIYHCIPLLLFCVTMTACTFTTSTTTPRASSKPGEVVLLLQNRDGSYIEEVYEIGEFFGHDLVIENHRDMPVAFKGVDLCHTGRAFSAPNQVYLLGPDEQNLLAANEVTVIEPHCPELVIEPYETHYERITVSAWSHLRQPGQYTLWLELQDERGLMHHTNQLRFQLIDIPANVATQDIALTLHPQKNTYTLEEVQERKIDFEITFANNTEQTLIFIEPYDISFFNCSNPSYEYTVIDHTNRHLLQVYGDNCDYYYPPPPPDDHFITLQAGHSHHFHRPLTIFPEMEQSGEYRVRLTYIVRTKALRLGHVRDDEPVDWPTEIFIGRLESNEVKLTVE